EGGGGGEEVEARRMRRGDVEDADPWRSSAVGAGDDVAWRACQHHVVAAAAMIGDHEGPAVDRKGPAVGQAHEGPGDGLRAFVIYDRESGSHGRRESQRSLQSA